MSSINLLPKSFSLEKNEKRQKNVIIICSIFLVSVSIISYLIVYVHKTVASKESDSLDYIIGGINNNIEKEINGNGLFLTVDKIESIRELLNDHKYFSKVFNIIQNIISEDVYLTESELLFDENEDLILRISGIADNHLAAVNQIAIFKNSYWIDNVDINNIAAESGNEVTFSGNLKLKKELVLFREYYWDFGLTLLSSKMDRYIKINEYSARLMNKESNGEGSVKIEFSGIAYDEKKLVLFEDDLKQIKNFVKDVSILYDSDKKGDDKIIKFEGEMELELF
ncbi:MAG: hypothetical protein KAJ19_15070 [Gammaproteobacteria bacterium]|nr:hypothetical protein [Gammaproteobacteria bacterium]